MQAEDMNLRAPGKAYVMAVIGAGGKTTYIERMAQALLRQGKKTAVMTTTHMRLPRRYSAVGKTWEEPADLLEREHIVYYGAYAETKGKMTFPGRENYEALCRKADVVLVEADGAKENPMKFPDWSREPVIPANTDAIILLFGLSALGKPLKAVCHRWALGGDGEEIVTAENVPEYLEKAYLRMLRFRFSHTLLTVLLNQADTPEKEAAGEQIRKKLEKTGVRCEVVQLRPVRISVIYMASGFSTRFGKNKLMEKIQGKEMYRHGLDMFLAWKEETEKKQEGQEGRKKLEVEILLVSQYQEILSAYRDKPLVPVENPLAGEGIAASVRLGTGAAKEADAYLFSVADQPWLRKETIKHFAWKFLDAPYPFTMACLCAGGKRGNPAIFHSLHRGELLKLTGDKGGSQIMKRYPKAVLEVFAPEKELQDIDRISDI